MNTQWIKISLSFFLIVALIGTALRAVTFFELPFDYTHLVHAHSHVAFQGWIYTLMMLFLTRLLLTEEQIAKGKYPLQFKLTILVIVGVLIAFSLQGYALYSIIFSTLFQLLNYWFIFGFFKDLKLRYSGDASIALKFIKTGNWLGFLSTLVPYVIGVLSAKGMGGTELYKATVYTFLHLQYNGWFLFVAIGLFYRLLENKKIEYHKEHATTFYWIFTIAILPSIALSLLGMSFAEDLALIAQVSAVLLTTAGLYFFGSLKGQILAIWSNYSPWVRGFLIVFLLSFAIKTIAQCAAVFPFLQDFAFQNKSVVLAYLHLTFIGVLSAFFLALMIELKWLKLTQLTKLGLGMLLFGFAGTEVLLVANGLGFPYFSEPMIFGSALMAFGVGLLMLSRSRRNS